MFPMPSTSAGGRLQQWSGLSRSVYLRSFDRVNLLRQFPGKDAGGEDKFPLGDARVAAQAMLPFLHGRKVVLIGRNVANAFGVKNDFFSWGIFMEGRWSFGRIEFDYVIIPHTSGRSRAYNDTASRELLRSVMKEALRPNLDLSISEGPLPFFSPVAHNSPAA